MTQVRFKRSARADLQAIKEHVHADNPRAAMRLIENLRIKALHLGEMPNVGRTRPELGVGLRSLAYGSYILFYTVEADIVWIQRIIHGARDLGAVFDDEA